MPSISDAWQYGRAQLRESPTPTLDARLLLESTLGHDHSYLVAHSEETLQDAQWLRFQALVARAAAHEPIPYLTGVAPFFGRDFKVTPAVLIPRPETELLVETAIEWAVARGAIRIADVGTGSGCIAVSLAAALPRAVVVAGDMSSAALRVAADNIAAYVPDRVQLVQTSLLAAMAPGLDLIVANLPYVADEEWPALPDGVKLFEPAVALRGGEDGLDLIRALLPEACQRLASGGLILLEIGWQQGDSARRLARELLPSASIEIRRDFAGHDRLVVIETPP